MEHHHLLEVEGVHVSRREDLRLITGTGKYASDWNLPGQLYAYFLRSDRAHAKIVSIDLDAAKKHPGVVRVYTGEDAVQAMAAAGTVAVREADDHAHLQGQGRHGGAPAGAPRARAWRRALRR